MLYQLTIVKNCHQLLKFAVILLVERKKILYPLLYLFIVINDYSRQDLALGKRIELWIGHYVDKNGLPLNYQLFKLQFS